jgi:hypothetical protein
MNKYKKYIEYIANDIEPPYFKSLEPYELLSHEKEDVFSIIFNQDVRIFGHCVIGKQEGVIYSESYEGYWEMKEYSKEGNLILWKNSSGTIRKWDNEGNILYERSGNGYHARWEYDENGNETLYATSDGVLMVNGNASKSKIRYEL